MNSRTANPVGICKEPTAENIFTVMDNNPDIPRINEHIELSYKRDKELIEFLNSATRIG